MRKSILFICFILFATFSGLAQKKGLNYQAVIIDPNAIEVPGILVTGQPLMNGKVTIRFTIKNSQGVDYEEVQNLSTDEFGLVNTTIGNGIAQGTLGNSTVGGIRYATFDAIVWDNDLKSLVVAVSFDNGQKYVEVSNQKLNFTPYALYAESVDYKNVRDSPKSLSQFQNDVGYLIPKDLDPIKQDISKNTETINANQKATDEKFVVTQQTIAEIDEKVVVNTKEITGINGTLIDHDNRLIANATKINNTESNLSSRIGYVQSITESTQNQVNNLGGAYETLTNKSSNADLGAGNPSDQLYPTQKATKAYIDNSIYAAVGSGVPDATTLAAGKVKLAGDLAGTATNPTVPALANKENTSNKSVNVQADGGSNLMYPSVKAVKDYVDQATMGTALQATVEAKADKASPALTGVPTAPTAGVNTNTIQIATTAFVQQALSSGVVDATSAVKGKIALTQDLGGTADNPTVPGLALKENISNKNNDPSLGNSTTDYPTQNAVKVYVDNQLASASIADASDLVKGKIQLGGDLNGTGSSAANPKISTNAITTDKIANAAITDAKIATISASKITGAVDITNGGTGAITASAALTNLGAQASANLSNDISGDRNSTTKYPAVKSIKEYVDNSVSAATIADADINLKGKIQLGGDLAGTGSSASAPVITDNAITSTKIADGAIVNDDINASAAIVDTKLATIATAGKVSNSATTASNANTASAIVARDANGNFVAGTITADLTGLASKATNINGGVIGAIPYQSAANTTSLLTGNSSSTKQYLTQTGTGSTSAAPAWSSVITADVSDLGTGVGTFLTTPTSANLATAVTNETGTGALVFANSPALITPNLGVPSAIDLTNATGLPVSAVTGILPISSGGTGSGTASGSLTALGAQSVANISTNMTDDRSSIVKYPAVKTIKDYVDASVTSGAPDATNILKGKIQLGGDLAGTNSSADNPVITNNAITTVKINADAVTSAKILDGSIVNADINESASIEDTKLATISTAGKVSNSATTATNSNTASAIVARDANGDFTAGTITADLTGLASKATNLNGGTLGAIPYQSAANTTTLLTGNTTSTKKFLTETGTGSASVAPAWGTLGTSDITDLGTNVGTFLATPTSVNLANAMTNETGTGSVVFNTSPTLFSPTIGEASATSVAFAGSTSGSALLEAPAVAGSTTITLPATSGTLATLAGTETFTNKTFTSPTFTSPILGTPASGLLTNATGLPLTTGITGTLAITNGGTGATSAAAALIALGAQEANLSNDIASDRTSTTKYPSVQSIKNYVDAGISSGAPDADGSTKGKIQLAGDLAGTGSVAAAPVITDNAITTVKIYASAVTSAKIADATIVNADISTTAAIADTKLATIATSGKVSNSATTADHANTASAIVARDANGNFAAGTITADLTGIASKTSNINGGTVGAIPYQTAANTTSLLSGNALATKKFLTQSGNGTLADAPVWAGVAVSDITGTLPVANGGTGVTSTAANLIFAGPTSGATASAPSFRALVAADLPTGSTNYVNNGTTQQASTDFNISGSGTIGTTLAVTGNVTIGGTATISGATTLSALIATKGVFTDASKRLTSTGTLGTEQGGTGMTSFNSGGAMYATSTSALTTGTLPTSAGGTGLTTYTSGGALYTTSTTAITSGTLPITAGGTGSATQNFVDITTAQTIAGTKIFSSTISGSISGNAATVTNGVYTTDKISVLAATTSAELAGVISNESGSGALVFATSPTLVTPTLGAAAATSVAFAGSTSGIATISAPAVAGTNTAITLPGASGTLATLSGTETLTNKTLTSPTFTAPALGIPASGTLTNAIGLPLTTGTTGTLPITKGGTGETTITAAFDALSPMTTAGDIIYGGTSGTGSRLGKGSDGEVLKLVSGVPAWGTDDGVTTMAAIGSVPNANGASISTNTLTLQPANASFGGVVTTGTQTFAGAKTFSSDITVNGITIGEGGGSLAKNTALGLNAMSATATGAENTAVGNVALTALTSGVNNVALGSESAMGTTTGQNNVAIGYQTLKAGTNASFNTAIGNYALTALNNTTTNDRNTAVGVSSLFSLTSGAFNTALGTSSLHSVTTGSSNVSIGREAGFKNSVGELVTTANNSVFIGTNTKPAAATTSNEIIIGDNAVGGGSNTTTLGSLNITNAKIFGALNLPNATASTSSTSGALTVAGGVGIAKELFIGSASTSTSTSTGSLVTAGGVGVAGTMFVGGEADFTSSSVSTSATTGALVVTGGVGIGGALNVGGNTKLTGTIEIDGGSPGAGKVLISDAGGLASWSNAAGSAVTTTVAAYQITLAESIIFYTGSAAGTFTIPAAAAGNAGKEITIKNKTAFNITLTPSAGDMYIDNDNRAAANVRLGIEASNNWVKLVSDGSQWNVLRALF